MATHRIHHQSHTVVFLCLILIGAALLTACGGHAARTFAVRSALDMGDPHGAMRAIDHVMGVHNETALPSNLGGENALFVLDRASIQQSIAQFDASLRDFGAADKAIDMLDLSHNAADTIGKYIFSDSAGKYMAPPYEKLLINTLNMINYLENRDLSGAKVEARRMSVMDKYLTDQLHEGDNGILGLAGFLAGLTFEESGDADEALRYYDEALRFAGAHTLSGALFRLLLQGSYKSQRLIDAAGAAGTDEVAKGGGDIVFVLGYGRVPHKIPRRVPIGLALSYVAGEISPADAARANRLAAQGLVTWINYPTLAPEQGGYETPICQVDGAYAQLEQAVNVTAEVRKEWQKIEHQTILSAITRMITRLAVGAGINAATRDSGVGFLASLATQATLTVLDTPDTRSWETLPARVAFARKRVSAGKHTVLLQARGYQRSEVVDVPEGGSAFVSLMALR